MTKKEIEKRNKIIKEQSEIIEQMKNLNKEIFKGWEKSLLSWRKDIGINLVLGWIMYVLGILFGIYLTIFLIFQ